MRARADEKWKPVWDGTNMVRLVELMRSEIHHRCYLLLIAAIAVLHQLLVVAIRQC